MRIASIDVGGGTTDLIITTYHVEENRALMPEQNFREGFNVAGDDILEGVVRAHRAAGDRGGAARRRRIANPRELMAELFGGDRASMAEQQKQLRHQFVAHVAHADRARAYCAPLEDYDPSRRAGAGVAPVRRVLRPRPCAPASAEPAKLIGAAVAASVEQAAQRAGAAGFSLARCSFPVDLRRVDKMVRNVMAQVLALLAETVHAYDCDLLLLSGRPSRLPRIAACWWSCCRCRPSACPAARYRVGAWYPFRGAERRRIEDPKTTVAVGAMLGALAERQLPDFSSCRAGCLRSTAKFIGKLDGGGRSSDEHLVFTDVDLDNRRRRAAEGDFEFHAPMLARLPPAALVRWLAAPLYALEFAEGAARRPKPFSVTLERADVKIDPDDSDERHRTAEASASTSASPGHQRDPRRRRPSPDAPSANAAAP